MRTQRWRAVVAAMLLLPTVQATAQQSATITEGTRVRVRAPSIRDKSFKGTLVGIDSGSLTLELDGSHDHEIVPLSALKKLEVNVGQKGNAGAGFVLGFGAGAGVAALVSLGMGSESGETVKGVAILGGIGAAIGALTGALIKTEHWKKTDIERFQVSLGPAAGGGVGVSVQIKLGR